jgi:hypothetical protein
MSDKQEIRRERRKRTDAMRKGMKLVAPVFIIVVVISSVLIRLDARMNPPRGCLECKDGQVTVSRARGILLLKWISHRQIDPKQTPHAVVGQSTYYRDQKGKFHRRWRNGESGWETVLSSGKKEVVVVGSDIDLVEFCRKAAQGEELRISWGDKVEKDR